MKTFLVPVEDHEQMLPTLNVALLLAKQFDGHLVGLAINLGDEVFIAGELAYVAASSVSSRHRQYERAHRLFKSFRDGLIGLSSEQNFGVSVSWAEHHLVDDHHVGNYSRSFDLTVLCRPQRHPAGPRWSTFRNVLLTSGKPVLVCPKVIPKHIGENILVLHDGSIEESRAIALSLPILKRADRVTILAAATDVRSNASAVQSLATLRRNGVDTDLLTFQRLRRGSGCAVLAKATELHCDLLIGGGYTQAGVMEYLFGSTTHEIISNSEIPVLMAN